MVTVLVMVEFVELLLSWRNYSSQIGSVPQVVELTAAGELCQIGCWFQW